MKLINPFDFIFEILIASKCDEEVGLPQLADYGHTVLIQLLEIAGATREVGAQDDAPTKQSLTSTSRKRL